MQKGLELITSSPRSPAPDPASSSGNLQSLMNSSDNWKTVQDVRNFGYFPVDTQKISIAALYLGWQ